MLTFIITHEWGGFWLVLNARDPGAGAPLGRARGRSGPEDNESTGRIRIRYSTDAFCNGGTECAFARVCASFRSRKMHPTASRPLTKPNHAHFHSHQAAILQMPSPAHVRTMPAPTPMPTPISIRISTHQLASTKSHMPMRPNFNLQVAMRSNAIVTLALLMGVAAVSASSAVSNRNLLQDTYNSFPFCKCEELPKNDPIRLGYTGVGPSGGETWVQFFIKLVDIPPTSSKCKDADLYKVEFRVAPNSKGCSTKALVGDLQRAATYEDLGGGRAIMRVSQLSISQTDISNAGEEGIPLWINLVDGCTIIDYYGPTFKYAMFNTEKDCCPVAIIPMTPPPAGFLPGPSAAGPPPPSAFPFCPCITNPAASPWRVSLESKRPIPGGERIVLKLYVDTAASAAQVTMNKLEFNLQEASVVDMYRGHIKRVTIGGRGITSVYWQNNVPTVKFTMLNLSFEDGLGDGVELVFDVASTTLSDLCGGPCQYAAYDHNGNTGLCPIGFFGP
eukprot:gene10310-8241_t